MKTCREIMIANPACCLADDKAYIVAQRMQTEDIDVLLVVANYQHKKLIGIITDRDIALRVVGKGRNADTTEINEIMTANPIVCHPLDDLDTTLDGMVSHNIRRVPVVDRDTRVMGIIVQARTIQARISVRINSENKMTAITVKDSFDGWADFANKLPVVLKQLTGISDLSEALNSRCEDASFASASTS
jgi:CBS domain-containing protein